MQYKRPKKGYKRLKYGGWVPVGAEAGRRGVRCLLWGAWAMLDYLRSGGV